MIIYIFHFGHIVMPLYTTVHHCVCHCTPLCTMSYHCTPLHTTVYHCHATVYAIVMPLCTPLSYHCTPLSCHCVRHCHTIVMPL